MSNVTTVIIGLFGLAFGGSVLLMGKHALLSQVTFLRLYNKFQKREKFGLKPFDLEYFGGTTKLRVIGASLVASGLFIFVSCCAISINRLVNW
jgi:hypothetical protein